MTTYINSDKCLLLNKYGPSGQGRAMNQRFPLMLTSDMSPTLKVSIFSGLTFKVGHSHPTLQFLYQLLIDHSPQKSCAVYFKQTARDDEFYTIVRLVLWSRNIMFKVSQNITMFGGKVDKKSFSFFSCNKWKMPTFIKTSSSRDKSTLYKHQDLTSVIPPKCL